MAQSSEGKVRDEYLRIEMQWLIVANAFEFAEKISGFIEWQANRVKL